MCGERLSVEEYCPRTGIICGKILSVERYHLRSATPINMSTTRTGRSWRCVIYPGERSSTETSYVWRQIIHEVSVERRHPRRRYLRRRRLRRCVLHGDMLSAEMCYPRKCVIRGNVLSTETCYPQEAHGDISVSDLYYEILSIDKIIHSARSYFHEVYPSKKTIHCNPLIVNKQRNHYCTQD